MILRHNQNRARRWLGSIQGFTLEELLVSLVLASVSMGSIMTGYVSVLRQSEWAANSTAAQVLAMQRVEQVRAAKWDPLAHPAIDEVVSANFAEIKQALSVPMVSTNLPEAKVTTTITTISTDPPLKLVRVDCIWPFLDRGYYTNTVITLRSPDQ